METFYFPIQRALCLIQFRITNLFCDVTCVTDRLNTIYTPETATVYRMGSRGPSYQLPLPALVVPTIQEHLVIKQTVPTRIGEEIKHKWANFATVNVCPL